MKFEVIEMLTTAADDRRILEKGKFYRVPAEDAKILTDSVGYVNQGEKGAPVAVKVRHARYVPKDLLHKIKITPIPGTPNPEDARDAWSQDESDDDE